MSSRLKKHLLIAAGSLALILVIIGIVLPVLPTTPFLLLASYCYMRSSKHLYDWLMNHKILGPYLYDYITYRGVRRKVRTAALTMLWLTLSISMILVDHFHIRLLLVFIGVAVSIHLLMLKIIENEQPAD